MRNLSKEQIVAKLNKEYSLVLRTCDSDGQAYGGFTWPLAGYVECDDFDAEPKCGHGLHGLLAGKGNSELMSWCTDSCWLVAAVKTKDIIDLDGKVKFPEAFVLCSGDRKTATDYLYQHLHVIDRKGIHGASVCVGNGESVVVGDRGDAFAGYQGTAIAGNYGNASAGGLGTAIAGDNGVAIITGSNGDATAGEFGRAFVGDYGTAVAAHGGKATAGYKGTATTAHHGTATAGKYGTATASYLGTAIAGDGGTATAGDYGTATAGADGTAVAGPNGRATAGERGTAIAGYKGTATAGVNGRAAAGNQGTIVVYWTDTHNTKVTVGYVGECGIRPYVLYSCNSSGLLVNPIPIDSSGLLVPDAVE